jgi:hypothetical protein
VQKSICSGQAARTAVEPLSQVAQIIGRSVDLGDIGGSP